MGLEQNYIINERLFICCMREVGSQTFPVSPVTDSYNEIYDPIYLLTTEIVLYQME